MCLIIENALPFPKIVHMSWKYFPEIWEVNALL